MKKLFEKLKKIKNIEIIAAVLAVGVIAVIYFSTLTPKADTASDTPTTNLAAAADTYADTIEAKLHNVISSIKNAGAVAVMVMTDGEGTSELAYDIEKKTVEQTGANGQVTTTTTENQKLLTGAGGKPIILWTNPPEIIGIVVVASGAGDPSVRLNIMRAVRTIVGEEVVNIEILDGN